MIHKLLIANRGEIAARVIRTARHLGLGTVAVHSEADADALHVKAADEAFHIGPAAARDSYLRVEKILAAAKDTGADAVHPGYGFLSESPALARACHEHGLTFVGPSPEIIEAMGSKTAARKRAQAAGLPVVPGSGSLGALAEALSEAERIGYPVLLKASAGGGGIGMRRIKKASALEKHFEAVQAKAREHFGDGAVYIEKLLERPRHVEIQIAADKHGNVVHMGERDCSVQRRHQKVLEETPSPGVGEELRRGMLEAAIALARHVGYDSLGTVEMLVDGDAFYFLEMNTRLQVEHTVTEMVTGLDLVEWQIHLALGETLPASQEEIRCDGHALQCRIYAENPNKGFLPSPGTITRFEVPTGDWVRNDVGVVEGDKVTPYYDPMIAKLIVHGGTREETISRARAAVESYVVEGIETNLDLHRQVLDNSAFRRGDYTTGILKEELGY